MRSSVRQVVVPIAVTSVALFGVAACGSDDDSSSEETTSAETTTEAPEEIETEEPEGGDAASGPGSAAPWATPVTSEGDLIDTIELGDLTVEVYQVAVDQATRSSIWADPETDEPLVAEGDDIVVLNYVVTNNGDPVNLSYGLVDVGLRYDDWPYLQQPSVSDSTVLENNGVNDNGVNSDSLGEDVYVLGTGEQYSVGEALLYQAGESYTVQAELVPRDDAGERDGDSITGEIAGTVE